VAAPLPAEPSGTSNAKEASRAAVAGVNVSLPATVVSFDADTQTVTVRIVPMFRRRDPNDKAGIVIYAPPDIPGVPVAYPGTGDFSIFWPLEVGDTGRIVCFDRSADEWKANGGDRTEPQDPRRHDLTDAVFCPDVRSPATPMPGDAIHATAMVIRADELRLGSSNATDPASLSSVTDANNTALAAAFSSWVPVPMDGGAALKTLLTTLAGTGWPFSVAASKVKIE
jgi:hypothetical protein